MITDRGALFLVGFMIIVLMALFIFHLYRLSREAESRANQQQSVISTRKENEHVR